MMKDHAKFTGEIAKGIKIGESSVEVKLLIPLKAALPHLLFLSSNQGKKLTYSLATHRLPLISAKKMRSIVRLQAAV